MRKKSLQKDVALTSCTSEAPILSKDNFCNDNDGRNDNDDHDDQDNDDADDDDGDAGALLSMEGDELLGWPVWLRAAPYAYWWSVFSILYFYLYL